jgi:glutathione S-transferase
MIDSERSRFLLWHYAQPYREERHIYGWASILAVLHGGAKELPLIYGNGLKLSTSRGIIDHFETCCNPSQILIPAQQPLRMQVEADDARFHDLAYYVARIAYFHLLPHPDILIEPFTRGIPWLEAKLTPAFYPALRGLITLGLKLSRKAVADSVEHASRIVEEVDRRIADGRRFLCGNRLTLSDLSFATAIAPLLLPEGYSAPIPTYAQMPAEMKQIIDSFRQRPTSALVSRIYALRASQSDIVSSA